VRQAIRRTRRMEIYSNTVRSVASTEVARILVWLQVAAVHPSRKLLR